MRSFDPDGFKSLLIDSQGKPIRVLEFGERKAEKAQRVRLTPGDPKEIAVIRRIFELRLKGEGYKAIAKLLNDDGIAPPGYRRV